MTPSHISPGVGLHQEPNLKLEPPEPFKEPKRVLKPCLSLQALLHKRKTPSPQEPSEPETRNPHFLSKDVCPRPGLEWNFLLRRTWPVEKLLSLKCPAHSSLTKENHRMFLLTQVRKENQKTGGWAGGGVETSRACRGWLGLGEEMLSGARRGSREKAALSFVCFLTDLLLPWCRSVSHLCPKSMTLPALETSFMNC